MKTITRYLVSTRPENYGEIIYQYSIEVDDDYVIENDVDKKEKMLTIQENSDYEMTQSFKNSVIPFTNSVILFLVTLVLILLSLY